MNAPLLIRRLESFAQTLPTLTAYLSDDEACWKPPNGAWSILEIVNHLGDEEVDDFRTRVRMTLERPEETWPPIDPEGWARERKYNTRPLAPSVDRFVRERAASIAWLRSLSNPDWALSHTHPRFGPIAAGDLLASWTAHDALHLRQIAKRMWELAARDAGQHQTRYAGDWSA